VHQDDDTLRNVYKDAKEAKTVGTEIDINADYRAQNVAVPPVKKMDTELRREIESEAGATLENI
jgi:hypothetical protein